jgi:hypothetical protein
MVDGHLAGPVRRQRPLHDRRHHGARDGQFRHPDQPHGPRSLQPSAALARDRFGAPERSRLIGMECSFAWQTDEWTWS